MIPRTTPPPLAAAELEAALTPLLELAGITLEDWQRSCLSLHLTHGTLSVRHHGRGPRGKLLVGVTERRAHRVVRELPED